LRGVAKHVDHLTGLGVTYLHLMPLLTPRPAPNDGGYAVADYRTIRPDLGDTDDLRELATTLRDQGISLCIDLVLNHTAREHAWAAAARAGDAEKRDYYLVFSDRHVPDQYEQSLPEVFPDFAPGSFTWDDELAAWVWTTFNDYQWDLNWANPAVLCEFAEILLGHANLGVEVFRLDAIAFLWKRLGTTCQNQPEVHDLTQALRTVARIAAPAVLFKAEAIVGPGDLPAYLGTGAHAGKVSDLAYHNSLMVQVWSMLASGEVGLAAIALQNLPQPPSTTAWITYLRCHDDIGWAIDDTDAWRAGLNGHAHRRFLADWYAGAYPGSWARGLVFQENYATGDRRISGSLASLAGLEAGDPGAVARILLAHAVILGFGGLPVLWMGDELGLLNDRGWADDPAHAADNRWVHRPRMPWPLADDDLTDASHADHTHGIGRGLARLLRVRASLPHLHAAHPTEVWEPRDPGVLLVVRKSPDGPLLAAYNMTDRTASVPSDVFYWLGMAAGDLHDHLSGARPRFAGDAISLEPYAAAWLTA
jgi:amylosucrase